jgi:hypothetical protein
VPAPPPLPSPEEAPEKASESAQPKSDGAKHTVANEDSQAGEKPKAAKSGESLYDLVKEGKASLPDTKPAKPTDSKNATSEVAKPLPSPAEPAKPEPAKPVAKVNIPSTAHVRIDVPKGMQDLLNKDTRMGPWVKQVVDIADTCYAQERKTNPLAEGTIPLTVIMHENERPDADVQKLPPALSGVVACATGKFMRIKMPLFTGPEGQKHAVKVVFTK